jgi:hypothetical protein
MTRTLLTFLLLTAVTPHAFGQLTLPSGKATLPGADSPILTTTTVDILQVQQLVPPTPSQSVLPAGITTNQFAFVGRRPTTLQACRFVGGVLCLDPGPNSDWSNGWMVCDPERFDPILQGVTLRKQEPLVRKCPDYYPGVDFIQTGNSGIRTFWALKYTPCGTTFTLDVQYACVTKTFPRRIAEVRVNRYVFRVVVRPETLRFVVEALHCQTMGLCEVPCITDEGLFRLLLNQADAMASAARRALTGSQSGIREVNDALDTLEATIVRYSLFDDTVWRFDPVQGFQPCAIFGGVVPGSRTIERYGFGIVDTPQSPCVCKLVADISCLKEELIGTDP